MSPASGSAAALRDTAPPTLVVASRDEADPGHPLAVGEGYARAIHGKSRRLLELEAGDEVGGKLRRFGGVGHGRFLLLRMRGCTEQRQRAAGEKQSPVDGCCFIVHGHLPLPQVCCFSRIE